MKFGNRRWISMMLCVLLCASACRLEEGDAPLDGAPSDRVSEGDLDAATSVPTGSDGQAPSISGEPRSNSGESLETESVEEAVGCVVVGTSNFSSVSGVGTIDVATESISRDLTSLYADTTLHRDGERVFALARLGADAISELDAEERLAPLWELSLGRRANPWDVRLLSDERALVALYGSGVLQELHLPEGAAPSLGEVHDLAEWADADGNAEPSRILLWEDLVLVIVQRLENFACGEVNGAVLALDRETLEPVPHFSGSELLEFAACNPVTVALVGDSLWIGLAGNYRVRGRHEDDGGLEHVDMRSGTSSGLVLTESDWGDADIVTIAPSAGGDLWVLLADETFETSLRLIGELDGESGAIAPAVSSSIWRSEGAYGVLDFAGSLWLADRTAGDSSVIRVSSSEAARTAWSADGVDADATADGRRFRMGSPPFRLLGLSSECGG